MKVLLISNYPPDAQESMLRYADMLEDALCSRGVMVETVFPPPVLGRPSWLHGPWKKWAGYLDKYIFAFPYLRKKAAAVDVIHICDHSNAMYLKCAGKKPCLITCHDLIAVFSARGKYPGVRVGKMGRLLQNWIAGSLMQAKNIVCVSQKTLQDVKELCAHAPQNLEVIYHPLHWKYAPASREAIEAEKAKCGLTVHDEYFFHVGNNHWYKNRLGVMRIFSELRKFPRFQNARLVLAGKPWTREMRDFAQRMDLLDALVERVDISNEELQALYSGAVALLFPSLEEGFGWPLLEAQACGCPVITSNRPPMTEIAGTAAIYIDPELPEQAAEVIDKNADDFRDLRSRGFQNLRRFAFDPTMDRYLDLYHRLIQANA